jgi:type IV pilus assembly protein PilC
VGLPKTLRRIGEKYEEKVEETTRNLSVLIEPFLLFIVWIGVLSVALSVILPIYSLIGNLNGQT